MDLALEFKTMVVSGHGGVVARSVNFRSHVQNEPYSFFRAVSSKSRCRTFLSDDNFRADE